LPSNDFLLQQTLRAFAGEFEREQLAQVQLTDTSATSVYSPATATRAIVTAILLVNTGSADATISVFHDDDGTTYNNTTIIWKGNVDAANNPPIYTVMLEGSFGMADASGNLAVQSDQAGGDITVTVYGIETP
jgi:hypothetical protein